MFVEGELMTLRTPKVIVIYKSTEFERKNTLLNTVSLYFIPDYITELSIPSILELFKCLAYCVDAYFCMSV